MNYFYLSLILTMMVSFSSSNGCICLGLKYRPICGRNKRTYFNWCFMACDNVRRAYSGPCTDCKCPNIVSPVCGDNGHTYVNSCEATCDRALVAYEGTCRHVFIQEEVPMNECSCPKAYDPVCGANNQTY